MCTKIHYHLTTNSHFFSTIELRAIFSTLFEFNVKWEISADSLLYFVENYVENFNFEHWIAIKVQNVCVHSSETDEKSFSFAVNVIPWKWFSTISCNTDVLGKSINGKPKMTWMQKTFKIATKTKNIYSHQMECISTLNRLSVVKSVLATLCIYIYI